MVLFAHLVHETQDHRVPLMPSVTENTGIIWGTGVDVFFIVSGFIMYYLTSENFGSRSYAAEFLKRRIVRVVPLYWLFTALMLVALWQFHGLLRHTDAPLSTVIASFLFFPVTRADGQIQPILILGWTLEYEMFFYGCFAVALLNRKSVGLSALVVAFVAFVTVGRFIPDLVTPLRFCSSPIIVEFLLGILLAHLYLRRVRVGFFAQGALLAIAFVLMAIMGHFQYLDRWIWGGLPAFVLVFGLTLGPQWKVQALAIGGDASYSFYLSHPFTLNAVAMLWTKTHLPLNGWVYVGVGMIVCLAVALGVYRFVELPMLGVLRRRFEPTWAEVSA